MHSLCKNDNIPMLGKPHCHIRKEIAIHLTRIITYQYKKLAPVLSRFCNGLCIAIFPIPVVEMKHWKIVYQNISHLDLSSFGKPKVIAFAHTQFNLIDPFAG